ncbi:MerR family transcriptional regulator [Evtepia sp.]|uniref:MerR family transcriptional regulator n=1 Tax=Evtepia sp. TaxID=2773933 RepID=UPI003F141500
MYTIGQVSALCGLPVSTLRYYDKEGLFPDLQRNSGIRKFEEKELEAIRVIECLKKSGLELRDIKCFMEWCTEGSATYPQRRALFLKQKEQVEGEIKRMNQVLDMIKFKCWYYEQAIQDGNEDRLQSMVPEEMPAEIRRAYENAHQAAMGGK